MTEGLRSPHDMQFYAIGTYQDVLIEFVVNTILVILATAAVGLRLYASYLRKNKLWVDDYACIASLCLLYCLYGTQIAYARYGAGTHFADIPMENTEAMLKLLVAYNLIYGSTLFFGKISYLALYKRIFVIPTFLITLYILLFIVIAWWLFNIFGVFLICRPFSSNWASDPSAQCGDRATAYAVEGAINVITDFAIMVLPVPFVVRLNIPLASKVGICATFVIGLAICAVSIVRMVALSRLDLDDISYMLHEFVFWGVTESSIVIINACIPTMRPLPKALFANATWNRSEESTKTANGYVRRITNGTFERMDDGEGMEEYPLTDARGCKHVLEVSANGSRGEEGDSLDGGGERGSNLTRQTKSTNGSPRVVHGRKGSRVQGTSCSTVTMGEGTVTVSREWSVAHKVESVGS